MSPQFFQKLASVSLLGDIFPELSDNQLKVCILYAMGASYDSIAQNCHISTETARTYLKRSIRKLNLEGYDALRSAVLMRAFFLIISKR
ncbi:helix-turn-helix transcriptional regulator [Salmonella sp. SKLX107313]|uniref:helix-turn-helix transcriptional regulator n=1 Tax=Salmonella sp. SKLX107313 TaxID=3160038 RepID=UPI003753ECEE